MIFAVKWKKACSKKWTQKTRCHRGKKRQRKNNQNCHQNRRVRTPSGARFGPNHQLHTNHHSTEFVKNRQNIMEHGWTRTSNPSPEVLDLMWPPSLSDNTEDKRRAHLGELMRFWVRPMKKFTKKKRQRLPKALTHFAEFPCVTVRLFRPGWRTFIPFHVHEERKTLHVWSAFAQDRLHCPTDVGVNLLLTWIYRALRCLTCCHPRNNLNSLIFHHKL